jgi:hypothetical protein
MDNHDIRQGLETGYSEDQYDDEQAGPADGGQGEQVCFVVSRCSGSKTPQIILLFSTIALFHADCFLYAFPICSGGASPPSLVLASCKSSTDPGEILSCFEPPRPRDWRPKLLDQPDRSLASAPYLPFVTPSVLPCPLLPDPAKGSSSIESAMYPEQEPTLALGAWGSSTIAHIDLDYNLMGFN